MPDTKKTYAENYKHYRTRAGLTNPKIAKALNFDRSTVTKWERGVSCPSAKTLVNVADLLGCTAEQLLRPVAEHHSTTRLTQ